mgnify:FL=1
MKNQVIDILEDINPGVDHEARVDLVDSRCIDSLTMIASWPSSKMHSTSRYPPSRSCPTISTRLRPYAP